LERWRRVWFSISATKDLPVGEDGGGPLLRDTHFFNQSAQVGRLLCLRDRRHQFGFHGAEDGGGLLLTTPGDETSAEQKAVACCARARPRRLLPRLSCTDYGELHRRSRGVWWRRGRRTVADAEGRRAVRYSSPLSTCSRLDLVGSLGPLGELANCKLDVARDCCCSEHEFADFALRLAESFLGEPCWGKVAGLSPGGLGVDRFLGQWGCGPRCCFKVP